MDTSELHLSDLAGNFMELEEPARIVLLPSLIESRFHHFIFTLRQIALHIITMFKASKRFNIRVLLPFFL